MTKFTINGSTTGKGSSIISVGPNPNNDPTQVNRGIIKIYKVTQDSNGNTIKSIKKTINLLQKVKSTDTVKVYRIKIWEPSKQFYIWAQAPNGDKEVTMSVVGTSPIKVVCQCYSATMDKHSGVIDNSTKAKTPMGIQCSDSDIEINMDGMADSVPLKDSYFNIKNNLNISRDVDIKIYPEAMANDLSQYAITIHLVINKYDTP